MSTVARRMTYCILLTLAIGVIACAGTPANPPGKAPGYHQDLWDKVAYLTPHPQLRWPVGHLLLLMRVMAAERLSW